MGKIMLEERDIVVPGEKIAEGMDFLPGNGTYRDNEIIKAKMTGMLRIDGKVVKIIPLSGRYMPKKGDKIIGNVIDILMSGWRVNIDSPYSGMIPLRDGSSEYIERNADLRKYYDIDDNIFCEITNVTSQKLIDLSMKGPVFKKLIGGRIIKINPNKVPRVIGKHGSMVTMIKNATGCNVVVGQNGLIWINGMPEGESVAFKAIKFVEENAHKQGLTEQVNQFLEKETGKKEIIEKKEDKNKDIKSKVVKKSAISDTPKAKVSEGEKK